MNDRLRLVQPNTALIYPYLGDGRTRGGVLIAFDERLPPVLGMVLDTHPECQLTQGQHIIFRPHSYEQCSTVLGEIAVIHDSAVAGILEEF